MALADQDHIGWKSWKLIAIHLLPKEHGENLGETRGGVGQSGVLEHKSGNISETRKDRGIVTMEAYIKEVTYALLNGTIEYPYYLRNA